jgi:hypothetical protein
MNGELLKEFISIGTDTQEDAEAIFLITTNYLDELKTEKYNAEFATLTEGLVSKMIVISQNFSFDDSFITAMENNLINFINVISAPNKNMPNIILYFNKVYSDTMKFYNYVLKLKPKTSINIGPFKPENSDRTKITLKISEAIDLIRNTSILKDSAKNNLVEKLTQVITELNNPKTDWNIYFRNIGNSIMLLSAFASLISGTESAKNLLESKSKLEEANNDVEKTSITLSQKDLSEVFIFDEKKYLNGGTTILLEEKMKPTKTNEKK